MDALARIKKEESRLEAGGLWRRIDDDLDLYNLVAFEMKDFKNQKVPRVDNVTLPDIKIFADRVLSVTGGAMPQIKIKSKALDDNARQALKNFLYGSFDNANEILSAKEMVPIHNALAWFGAIRGWVCARVLVTRSEGKVAVDILPLDRRYLWYGKGRNGLRWGAYQTVRDAEEIIDEYAGLPGVNQANLDGLTKTDIKVIDDWDKEKHIVYANRKEILSEKNQLGYVPIVIQPVSLKPTDGKDDYLKRLGDSIFAAIRGINIARNKTATILQTLNVNSCMGAYEWIGGGDTPEDLPGTGSITDVEERTKGWRLVQLPDAYQATAFSWQIFDSAFQRGTYAHIEYGGVEFPLSSLALERLETGRDQILMPLLQALTIVYRDICKMVINQFKGSNLSAELGADDVVATYTAAEIPDSGYNIKFVFKTTVISEAGAAYQMATLAKEWLPNKVVLEEILKVDNAEEMERQKLSDQAGELFPQIAIYRIAAALEALGKKDEADILKDLLEQAMEQLQGQQAPPQGRAIAPRAAPEPIKQAPKRVPQVRGAEEVPRA